MRADRRLDAFEELFESPRHAAGGGHRGGSDRRRRRRASTRRIGVRGRRRARGREKKDREDCFDCALARGIGDASRCAGGLRSESARADMSAARVLTRAVRGARRGASAIRCDGRASLPRGGGGGARVRGRDAGVRACGASDGASWASWSTTLKRTRGSTMGGRKDAWCRRFRSSTDVVRRREELLRRARRRSGASAGGDQKGVLRAREEIPSRHE